MKQIEIQQITKQPSYIELTYTMRFNIPATLQNGIGGTLSNAAQIINSYGFDLDTISNTGTTYVTKMETKSYNIAANLNQVKNFLIANYNTMATTVNNFQPKVYDSMVGGYYDGTSWTIPS